MCWGLQIRACLTYCLLSRKQPLIDNVYSIILHELHSSFGLNSNTLCCKLTLFYNMANFDKESKYSSSHYINGPFHRLCLKLCQFMTCCCSGMDWTGSFTSTSHDLTVVGRRLPGPCFFMFFLNYSIKKNKKNGGRNDLSNTTPDSLRQSQWNGPFM